jgi:stalled ribosome alternative rescue factor ArfA
MKANRSTVTKGLNLAQRQHKPSKGKGSYDRRSFKDNRSW